MSEITGPILIATDKFKGSLSAIEVSSTISKVVRQTFPRVQIRELPIADGGDGSLDVLLSMGFKRIKVHSYNALMEPHEVSYAVGEIDGMTTAFIEMANVCGIASLGSKPLQPFFASSYGLGEVAYQVLETGIENIIVSVGGSASTDGGIGFLVGLGAIVRDSKGAQVSPNLYGLGRSSVIDLSLLHPRATKVRWTFLVDVTNPLTGPLGAAHVFGPQKGLKPHELNHVDEMLSHWGELLSKTTGTSATQTPGAGAAGGVPMIALTIFQSDFQSGAEWFYRALNLDEEISDANLVITGEGSFDSQSLMGKGPGYILKRALSHNKQVGIVAGRIDADLRGLEGVYKASLVECTDQPGATFKEPQKWLERATENLLNELKNVTATT